MMIKFKILFNRLLKDRIFQHILFWCLSFLILINILKVSAEIKRIDLIYTAIFHVPIMSVVYLNLQVLFPPNNCSDATIVRRGPRNGMNTLSQVYVAFLFLLTQGHFVCYRSLTHRQILVTGDPHNLSGSAKVLESRTDCCGLYHSLF